MKRKEFEKLLNLMDRSDPGLNDFSVFSDPVKARKSYDELIFYRSESGTLAKDFSPYFTDKVMGRISQLSRIHGLEEYISMQFSRVMAYGLAAVVLVIITLFFFQGQDGLGTVIGTEASNDINFISSLFYEF